MWGATTLRTMLPGAPARAAKGPTRTRASRLGHEPAPPSPTPRLGRWTAFPGLSSRSGTHTPGSPSSGVSPLLPYSSGGRSYGTGKEAAGSWLPEKNFCFTLKRSRPCRHTGEIYDGTDFLKKDGSQEAILSSWHSQQNTSYFRAIFNVQ